MKLTRLSIEIDFYILSSMYVLSMILLKWSITPKLEMLLFAIGALIGLFLFDVLTAFTQNKTASGSYSQPMLKSLITQAVVTILTLFVLTSTSSILGRGMILVLNLRLLYLQYHAFKKGMLATWIGDGISKSWYIGGLFGIFIMETILFVLI